MSQPTEPVAKKQKKCNHKDGSMQSHEANLEIEIGGDGNEGGAEKVTRFYNSAVLANQSKYIDAMLASPMKESGTYKISFNDTLVETFDLALKFVLNAAEARKIKVTDVIAVAKFYDQYNFRGGHELCAQVLLEYFKSLHVQEQNLTLDLDMLVDAVVVSFLANLTQAYESGSNYVKQKMSFSNPIGVTMFGKKHIQKLVPVLAELVEKDKTFLTWVTPSLNNLSIKNPLFPELFVARVNQDHASHMLISSGRIRVSGSGITSLDGVYAAMPLVMVFVRNSPIVVGEKRYERVCVGKGGSGRWTVMALNGNRGITLWTAKYSACLSLPPKDNWKPVHPVSKGSTLKVEYKRQTTVTLG